MEGRDEDGKRDSGRQGLLNMILGVKQALVGSAKLNTFAP